jgi:hypothetical protein
MTAAEVCPSATIASDDRRARIGAAVRRVDAIQLSPDVGRLLVHWLGQHAEWAVQRYGCAPDGLEAVAYALAEACAADSHGASLDPIPAFDVAQSLVEVKHAASVLNIKPTTVRWHYKNGTLAGRKVGETLMIDSSSLEQLRARREREEV